MPLSRMTVPKALRDRMSSDLGLDGYQGTPEKINNDAVLPVYVMGSAAMEEPFLSQHGFTIGEEQTNGLLPVCRASIWGSPAVPIPSAKAFEMYPNNREYFLALNNMHGFISITSAGRSTIAGHNSNTVRVELKIDDGTDYAMPWVLAQWKWNIGSFAGNFWYGEFFFNNSYLAEVSSPNRIKTYLNSSLGVNLTNPKGFILYPRGGYWLELSIQSSTGNLDIPAETIFYAHMQGDFYKTNTQIL